MDDVHALGKRLSNWGRWGDDDERGTTNLLTPERVAAAAAAAGRRVFIVALRGFAEPDVVAPYPHAELRMGAAGEILAALRRAGVGHLVLRTDRDWVSDTARFAIRHRRVAARLHTPPAGVAR